MPKSFKIIDQTRISAFKTNQGNQIIWSKAKSKIKTKTLRIFTGSSDKTIKVQENSSANETNIITLHGHTSTITCMLHLIECNTLVSGSSDSKIKIWSLSNDKIDYTCENTLEGHQSSISCLVSMPNENDNQFLSAGLFDKTMRMWDVNTGVCLKIIEDNKLGATSCLLFISNVNLVSGSWDKTVKMWSIKSGKCLLELRGHTSWINCLLYKYDFIYSGSSDKTIKAWQKNKCIRTYRGHKDSISSLVSLPNTNEFASGSFDKSIRIWDTHLGSCLKKLPLVNSISCLLFNEHTEKFISTCAVFDTNVIRFCYIDGREIVESIKSDHRSSITSIAI